MVVNKKAELEHQGGCSNDLLGAQGQRLQAGLHLTPSWTDGTSTRPVCHYHCSLLTKRRPGY